MSTHSSSDVLSTQARKRLTRVWLVVAAISFAVLVLVAWLLLSQWVMAAVGRWAIIAALAIFYELRILRQTLPLMHFDDEDSPAAGLGLVGKMTIASGLSFALLAGFILVTTPEGWLRWIPSILGLAGLVFAEVAESEKQKRARIPVGDEHLAREFRALGALVITAIAIHYGKLDAWVFLIGLMPYALIFTQGRLERKGKTARATPRFLWRRHFLNLFLIASSIAFFPAVGRDFSMPLAFLFGLPYFLIALRDWFFLTGLLDPEQSQYRQLAAAINRALTGWLALSIRLLAAMAVATVLADIIFHFDVYATAFSNDLVAGGLALMLLVALPFLFLGVRARLAALAGFIVLAAIILGIGWNIVIFVGLILLGLTIMLGQGKMAVEQKEPTDY